jgi:hypothetical protein
MPKKQEEVKRSKAQVDGAKPKKRKKLKHVKEQGGAMRSRTLDGEVLRAGNSKHHALRAEAAQEQSVVIEEQALREMEAVSEPMESFAADLRSRQVPVWDMGSDLDTIFEELQGSSGYLTEQVDLAVLEVELAARLSEFQDMFEEGNEHGGWEGMTRASPQQDMEDSLLEAPTVGLDGYEEEQEGGFSHPTYFGEFL